ncbi:MAG: hypothetical protein ACYTF1_15215 [Planctomycetota bacterium]|jgi:hypothetical protein
MNISRELRLIGWFIILGVISQGRAQSTEETFYGEPVELKSNYIYFTSWKYVRQGGFHWKVEYAPGTTEAEKLQGSWLKGDSDSPARFETIDMPRGIRLVAQQAEKVPYQAGQMAAQVYDQGKYKTWYTIPPCPDPESFSSKDTIMPGHNGHVCYTESEDSVTWHRPKLGLYEYAGKRDNNIVFRGDLNGSTRGFHGGCVFVDPSSTAERYKMFYLGQITDEEWEAFDKKYPGEADTMARRRDVGGYRCVQAVFGAVSPDGMHWKSLPEPLMIQHADTLNNCYYDVDLKKYVAYIRVWEVNPRTTKYSKGDPDSWITVGRRSIGRSYSKDFRHFSKPEIVFSTGADMPPSHLWYTNGKTTLPGCRDNHVMFPWLWELESDGGAVWLLSSSTGAFWSKVPGGPVVDTGPVGTTDGLYLVCKGNLLEYPGDKWGISYDGQPIPHKYPGRDISKRKGLFPGVRSVNGLATWPKGRLVALQCDEEGQFATVAVIPEGNRIRLNAIVKPTGYIKVAIRIYGRGKDVNDRSFVDSDRMIGDNLAMPVTWNSQANLNHTQSPIILRFQLKQAKLFGIEFY